MNQELKNRECAILGARTRTIATLVLSLFCLVFLIIPRGGHAATVTWDGGGDGVHWSDRLNWDGDTLPQSADDIVIEGNDEVHLDIDFTLAGTLRVGGGGTVIGTLVVDSGVALVHNGSATLSTVGAGSALINNGTISNSEFQTRNITLGRGTNFTNNGSVTGNLGVTMLSNTPSQTLLTNNGMFAVHTLSVNGTFDNNGDVAVTGNTSRINIINGIFNNHSTVTNSNLIDNAGTFNNFGTLDNTNGTFQNNGIFNSECNSILLGTIAGNPPVAGVCDTTPPVITVPGDITAEATSLSGAVVSYSASANDNTDGAIPPTCNPASGSTFALGTTTVSCTATDQAGNTGSASFAVHVVDTTPPVLIVPPDVTAEANAILSTIAIGAATATDIFPVTISNNAPAAFPLGQTIVIWTATDANGNAISVVQLVTVVDTTPPVLTVPANVTAEANAVLSTVAIGTATATDIFPVAVTSNAPATFPLGNTVVTWTATDANGNASTGTQTVTVVDTTPPVLTVPADVTVTATGALTAVNIGTATATDIFEPVTISNNAPSGGFPAGTTEVTWTATDANGNAASAVQRIHVVYQFGGFLAPVVQGGIYKAGRTLPVKIRAFLANGTLVPNLNATLSVQQLTAGVPSGDPLDISSTSAADSGTTFRLSDDLYIFNLNTRSLATGTYRLFVDLHDGSAARFVDIALK